MAQKIKLLLILVIILAFSSEVKPQVFNCTYIDSSSTTDNSSIYIGRVKPNRTTLSGDSASPSQAHFPVLIVFVQFQDDAHKPDWPDKNTNSGKPIYLDSLIATPDQYNNPTAWWNAYNESTQIFSDHYMELSRGTMHILGKAYSVVLSGNRISYTNESNMNDEIIDSLTAQGIFWTDYDRWSYNDSTNLFYYLPDKRVDMIFRVVKSRAPCMHGAEGYNQFGTQYSSEHMIVQGSDTTYVNPGGSYKGSGVTGSLYTSRDGYLGVFRHELGHQLFSGGHSTYSSVSYGFGYEGFYSPNDMYVNEYMQDTAFNFSNTTFTLGDYSSRNSNSTGNLLKVTIGGSEHFSLAFRNKESHWDRVMLGDTAFLGNWYDVPHEYGRGLYIYHFRQGYKFPSGDESFSDLECADGYWNWEYGGQHYRTIPIDCYKSGATAWAYWKKTTPRYNNDSSTLHKLGLIGDGISFHYNTIHDPNVSDTGSYPKWWGVGKQEASNCQVGTDRILTNLEEVYTKLEFGGDRYDPWMPGYNEVFSPYSSPSTTEWDQTRSGIFIWFYEEDNGSAKLKIWRATEDGGNTAESTILQLTPPSRPMGIKEETCVYINGQNRPKISWVHNMEPDMDREDPLILGKINKRYKVYRSVADDMSKVPPDSLRYSENVYTHIATVDIDSGVTPTYIDTALISGCYIPDGVCPPNCWVQYPIRYRVQAIDVDDSASVLSDFVNTTGIKTESGDPGGKDDDNISGVSTDTEIPTEFALKQNYPNPFNPSTNIQFDLPKDRFVTIKVYDITGKEIAVLVNEFKQAGSYIVAFNGSNLASGIYYYTIKAENFKETQKMVLMK